MENVAKTILIITTRHYPFHWKDYVELEWDCKKMDVGEDADRKDMIMDEDFRLFVKREPKTIGCFEVFVVPCLKSGIDDDTKGKYLEMIVKLAVPTGQFDNVFLIAHDKDFKVAINEHRSEMATEDDIPGGRENCPQLTTLVTRGSACMFIHELDDDIGKILIRLENDIEEGCTEKDVFCEMDCQNLVGIIKERDKKRRFFIAVNEDDLNKYPKIK